MVAQLKREYEAWFADVTKKGFAPPRIVVGSEKENPVRLSRQDWRGPKAGWAADSEGYWEVKIERAGKYRVMIRSNEPFTEGVGNIAGREFRTGMFDRPVRNLNESLDLPAGDARVTITLGGEKDRRGPTYVELEYLGKDEKK